MVGNSDESGWRRPPARRGISRSPPQWPQPVASFRTREGGFWYRISLPYRRSLFFTPNASENASRTPGSLFEHGTHIRYQRRPTPVPNATKPEMGNALPAANLSNCQKRGGHCKSAARNATKIWVKWKTLCIE